VARLASIRQEIDAQLRDGGQPTAGQWTAELTAEQREEVETLLELRSFAIQCDQESGDESLLAGIEAEVLDQIQRGEEPDLIKHQARHPHLSQDMERLLGLQQFVSDALAGEISGGFPIERVDDAETPLGRFRILQRIADHPVGTAYLGVSDDPPERVELLVLDPRISREAGWNLLRDAEQARNLVGPGFLAVKEVGEVRGVRFVASEYREGVTLAEVLMDIAFHGGERSLDQAMPPRGRPVGDVQSPEDRAEATANAPRAARRLGMDPDHLRRSITLVAQVARIMARAHLAGRLHRSLVPAAIVIARDGAPFVRWFGLTRNIPLTHPDGTPIMFHRAPECILRHRGTDWRADVWGVGALLYALLRLEPPLIMPAGLENVPRLAEHGPEELTRNIDKVHPSVRPTLSRALAWTPEHRHASCDELATELETLLQESPPVPDDDPTPWFRRVGLWWGRRGGS
jgi:serine/threonine-protein kinase